ncbi:MAG: hypothetical protein RI925_424, partial [Pseudomonadota bacterium]
QPRLKFWLLDEGAFPAAELEDMQRVVAAIFCFEHTPDSAAAKRTIRNLADAVAHSPFKQRIDRVVTRWTTYLATHGIECTFSWVAAAMPIAAPIP